MMGNLDRAIIINRLAKIKYLYKIGMEQSKQVGTFAGFSILSFHDSAEMFLLLVLEEKGDPRPRNERSKEFAFMKYWDYFEDLTLKESMNNLKERRRNIKHKGLFPSSSDIEESRITITNFFKENTLSQFGIDFDTISISDLIVYQNIKDYIDKAECFLSQGDVYNCLVNAKIGFIELLSTYESDKVEWCDSIYSVGEKVGNDYRNLVSSNKEGLRWFEQVTKTSNAVRDILKISALGIDYRKYALFDFITPKVLLTCGVDSYKDNYVAERIEHFEMTRSIKPEDCRFCIDFVMDCALKLQEFQFSLKDYLKDMV